MSALNKISMAIAGLFGIGSAATPLANRNYIVDGACEYVQGGSTAISGNTAVYTANAMWIGGAGTGGAATVSNQSARTNGLGGDTNSNGLYAHSQTTASTGSMATFDLPYMMQRTEFVNKLAGKSVTLSMKLMVASGAITVPGVFCRQSMGTGGSPSSNTTLDKSVNWAVTTTQKKFSVRIDLPSVSGLTLGTNSNDFTSFGVYFPAGWTGTVYVTEVQVELSSPRSSGDLNGNGGLATAFEYRGWSAEYARIQRYFQLFGSPFGAGTFSLATQGLYDVNYPGGPMRTAPAVTFNGTFQCSYPGNNVSVAGASMAATGQNSQATMVTSTVSGMTAGQGSVLWGNTGASITLDARL